MKFKSRIFSGALIFVLVFLCKEISSGNCTSAGPGAKRIAGMKKIGQTDQYSCWVETGIMILKHFDLQPLHCQFTTEVFGMNCCSTSTRECFGRSKYIPFEHFHYISDSTSDEALPFDDIIHQIEDRNLPIVGEWLYGSDDNGHTFAVAGYCKRGPDPLVYILNPEPRGRGSARWVLYSYYNNGDSITTRNTMITGHGKDYFNIRHN